MKLKYPIQYIVERPGFRGETENLVSDFSRFESSFGLRGRRPSYTVNRKKAVRAAKKHGGSVVALWLEDRESDNGLFRHNTFGRKTVFGEPVVPDNNHGNKVPEELL